MSHSIKWPDPIAARRVEIEGATAYAIAGLLASFLSFIETKHFLKKII
jgi:5'-nucleotidase